MSEGAAKNAKFAKAFNSKLKNSKLTQPTGKTFLPSRHSSAAKKGAGES